MEGGLLHDVRFWLLAGAIVKRIATLLATLLLSVFAQAQTPSIVSLNDADTLVTHVALPFHIAGVTVKERTASVQSTSGSCKVMLDPFYVTNFLVKCTKADQFSVQVWVRSSVGEHRINYGPVTVALITDQTVVTPEPQDPRFAQGQQLFNALCTSCHTKDGTQLPLQGKTAADITQAISTVSAMRSISLTTAEKDAIAFYLGN